MFMIPQASGCGDARARPVGRAAICKTGYAHGRNPDRRLVTQHLVRLQHDLGDLVLLFLKHFVPLRRILET